MHRNNIKFIFLIQKLSFLCSLAFAFIMTVSFVSCTKSPPVPVESHNTYQSLQVEKQALLKKTFDEMLVVIQKNLEADSLLPCITEESKFWLEDLEYAALTETDIELEQRPFNELLAILAFRLYLREHLFSTDQHRMLELILLKKGFFEMVISLPLGPFEVKNDRGSLGLAKSPKVPVILFTWDDISWRMDIKNSLPLITKGLETIGVKKNWSNTTLALYLLEKEFRYDFRDINETLLNPVPSI